MECELRYAIGTIPPVPDRKPVGLIFGKGGTTQRKELRSDGHAGLERYDSNPRTRKVKTAAVEMAAEALRIKIKMGESHVSHV